MKDEPKVRAFFVLLMRKYKHLFSPAEHSEIIDHVNKLNGLVNVKTSTDRYTIFKNIEVFFDGLSTSTIKSVKQIDSHIGNGVFVIGLVTKIKEAYYVSSLNE